MPATIKRSDYAAMYGPTTGDRMRLADTDLIIEVERDLIEEERRARARLASLRDPERLARLAESRGFAVPDRIVRVSPEATER